MKQKKNNKDLSLVLKTQARLGGYKYQTNVGVLRLIDLLDSKLCIKNVSFENPSYINGKDYFDDIKIRLSDNTLHWFQIKWGFQQSIDKGIKNLSLSSFIKPKSVLFLGNLFNTWNAIKTAKEKVICHIYTSKSYSDELKPLLKPGSSLFSDNGETKTCRPHIYSKMSVEYKKLIPRDKFIQFLSHLILSFNQPSMYLEPIVRGALTELILKRISKLGLPYTVFKGGQQFTAQTIYTLLYKIASDASVNRRVYTKEKLLKELRIDPQKGAIFQPRLVIKEELVFQKMLKHKIEKKIQTTNKQFIFLIGKPGSGKSWFLESWQKKKRNPIPIFYCFRGLDDNEKNKRVFKGQIIKNFIHDIDRFFPNLESIEEEYACTKEALEKRINKISVKLQNWKKQIFIVDGLDHIERIKEEGEISPREETVIGLLEELIIPKNIIFLLGTQPGTHLKPIITRGESILTNGFNRKEVKEFLKDKHNLLLSNSQIYSIYESTKGIPLILSMFTKDIKYKGIDPNNIENCIASLPKTKGDVNQYYNYLWNGLRGVQRSKTETGPQKLLKYLALSIGGLTLKRQQMRSIIPKSVLTNRDLNIAIKQILALLDLRYLLQKEYILDHNSFKEFILQKFQDEDEKRQYIKNFYIYFEKIKNQRIGNRYYFAYLYENKKYEVILDSISLDYIDRSVIKLFPYKDIIKNIDFALKSAFHKENLGKLISLGLLKYYSERRFENIEENELIKFLIPLGKITEIKERLFYENRLNVPINEALEVLLDCRTENVNLPYSDWFTEIRQKIHLLDKEQIKEIDYDKFIICLVFAGDPTKYFSSVIKRNTANKSKDIKDSYYIPFINALKNYGKTSSLEKILAFNNLGDYSIGFKEAYINSLIREGNSEKAKSTWIRAASKKKKLGVSYLKLGCELGIDPNRINDKIDVSASLISPLTKHSVPDNYVDELKFFELLITILSYCNDRNELQKIKSIILNLPKNYLKTYISTSFSIHQALGHKLAKRKYKIDMDFIKELFSYEDSGSEKPRMFDVALSRRMSQLVCILIENIFNLLDDDLRIDFINYFKILFKEKKKYSVSGSGFTFPDNFSLLNTALKIFSQSKTEYLKALISEQIMSLQEYIHQDETYERNRTASLLQIGRMWVKVGKKKNALKLFKMAMKDAHSYGYHKDITINKLVESLHYFNKIDAPNALARCASVAELTRFLGSLTDWREVKWAMPSLSEEIARHNTEAIYNLLNYFEKHSQFFYYNEGLLDFIKYTKSNYDLRYILSETITDYENVDDITKIFDLKLSIIDDAIKANERGIAYELFENLKRFLLIYVTQSARPKLISSFNKLSKKLDVPPIVFPTKIKANETNGTSYSVVIKGVIYNQQEIERKINRAVLEGIKNIWDQTKAEDRFRLEEPISQRLIKLVRREENKKDIEVYEQIIKEKWNNYNFKDSMNAIAEKYEKLGLKEKFVECALWECKNTIGWGGIFNRDNVKKFVRITYVDNKAVEKFLAEELLENSLNGYYTGWCVPVVIEYDISLGNFKRAKDSYEDFYEFVLTLFRHVIDRKYEFKFLLKQNNIPDERLLISTIIHRLYSPELEIKHRNTYELARLVRLKPKYLDYLSSELKKTNNYTIIISILLIIHYLCLKNLDSNNSVKTQLRKILKNANHIYIKNIITQVLSLLGEKNLPLDKYKAPIILLTNPSLRFINEVYYSATKYAQNLIDDICSILELQKQELLAGIEAEAYLMGLDFDETKRIFSEQLESYYNVNMGTIPFECINDYFIIHGLFRYLHKIENSINKSKMEKTTKLIHFYDPNFFDREIETKPSKIQDIPSEHEINNWMKGDLGQDKELSIEKLDNQEIILGEFEYIDNENIRFNRIIYSVFVKKDLDLKELRKEAFRNIFLKSDRVNTTIRYFRSQGSLIYHISHGEPIICYQDGFWLLQGTYNYMRIHPQISHDVGLTWAVNSYLDMNLNGDTVVKFFEWRNGLILKPFLRKKEHYGCRIKINSKLFRNIIQKYNLNILVIENVIKEKKKGRFLTEEIEESSKAQRLNLYYS